MTSLSIYATLQKKENKIKREKFVRVNERIRFSPITVIDASGTNLGQLSLMKARALAEEDGLDLVEINPNARPPICKIMDWGKFRYDQAKREKAARQHQKETELKEIRLTAKISDHDIEFKTRQAKDFFLCGHKVKVSMRLRGRENAFIKNAFATFEKFREQCGLDFERPPQKQGSSISVFLTKPREINEIKKPQSNTKTSSPNQVG